MLILHTAHSYEPDVSGIAGVVGQLSVKLARLGHEVHVATMRVNGALAKEVVNGVHVHRFEVKGNKVTGIRGAVTDYLKFVHSVHWDVIGMHCTQIWTTDLLLERLEELPGVKVCVTHGLSAWHDNTFRSYYSDFALSYAKLDAAIALSPLCEETAFVRHFNLQEPIYIPNGVDEEEVRAADIDMRSKLGIGSDPILVCMSNHAPLKGHSRFVRVLARVRKHIPHVRGFIIGKPYGAAKWGLGRCGIKGGCWYKCRVSALGAMVELLPTLTRTQVLSLLKQADVFLLPSTWEAYPLVLLEARAVGVPWVAFNVGCIRENPGGFVVDTENAMAARTVELVLNPDLRRELANEGRATLFPDKSWDAIAKKYEALYEGLVTQRFVAAK
jgi:glycosyltransferase involved in cell wall biosynthesis